MKLLTKEIKLKERIKLILQLTKSGNENIRNALVNHLTKSFAESDTAVLNNCKILAEH